MANFYNSISLSKDLLEKKILINGTFRRKRGIPENFFTDMAEKFDYKYDIIDENISIFNFNDNKPVIVGSSAYKNEFIKKEKKVWLYDKPSSKKIASKVIKKYPKPSIYITKK